MRHSLDMHQTATVAIFDIFHFAVTTCTTSQTSLRHPVTTRAGRDEGAKWIDFTNSPADQRFNERESVGSIRNGLISLHAISRHPPTSPNRISMTPSCFQIIFARFFTVFSCFCMVFHRFQDAKKRFRFLSSCSKSIFDFPTPYNG